MQVYYNNTRYEKKRCGNSKLWLHHNQAWEFRRVDKSSENKLVTIKKASGVQKLIRTVFILQRRDSEL